MLEWLGLSYENLEKCRQVKKNQSIKRDLNPLNSVPHARAPTTTPPLLLLLPIIIPPPPFHRQTLELETILCLTLLTIGNPSPIPPPAPPIDICIVYIIPLLCAPPYGHSNMEPSWHATWRLLSQTLTFTSESQPLIPLIIVLNLMFWKHPLPAILSSCTVCIGV